jgi:hypothetical protein
MQNTKAVRCYTDLSNNYASFRPEDLGLGDLKPGSGVVVKLTGHRRPFYGNVCPMPGPCGFAHLKEGACGYVHLVGLAGCGSKGSLTVADAEAMVDDAGCLDVDLAQTGFHRDASVALLVDEEGKPIEIDRDEVECDEHGNFTIDVAVHCKH